jgi:amino acid adenylation domain-containing protein
MSNVLVQQYLDHAVNNESSRAAVTDGRTTLSYRELDVYSNRIANGLLACGVKSQDRVVFCLERSIETLVVILGVLKADAIYVPLDFKAPLDRLKDILDDCSPSMMLCDCKNIDKVLQLSGNSENAPPILQLVSERMPEKGGLDWVAFNCHPGKYSDLRPVYQNSDQDIAYILYTSGSTGKPKGVMISHHNISSYIDWAVNHFQINKDDRVLSTAPFHFDMSTFDIYCSLKAACTLCIAKDEYMLFPSKLVNFIEQEGVTIWKGVSSLLMYMSVADVLKNNRMPTLKRIVFAGEPFPAKHLRKWMCRYPDKTFYNGYGPTETTGVSLCYRVEQPPGSAQEKVPIGIPRDGMCVHLWTEDNDPVKAGEVGELCLSGQGLSRGYLNDPFKTSLNFVENIDSTAKEKIYKTGDLAVLLPCGNYQFVGRKDRQLKFMGYRIEAGDVEHALMSLDGVNDVAVVFHEPETNKGKSGIVAFIETSGSLKDLDGLSSLKNYLPMYMIPKHFVALDKIPRCNRGKVKYIDLNMNIDF